MVMWSPVGVNEFFYCGQVAFVEGLLEEAVWKGLDLFWHGVYSLLHTTPGDWFLIQNPTTNYDNYF